MGACFVKRLLILYVVVLAWSLLVYGRLLDLQLVRGGLYRAEAEQQVFGFRKLMARRGEIFDRQLHELAVSVPVKSLSANPHQIEDPVVAARQLAPLVDVESEELFERLASDRVHVYLKRRLGEKIAGSIADLNIEGLYLETESKRVYPASDLAGQVLGFVGSDGQAWSGVELQYNANLRGQSDEIELQVDARRRSFGSERSPRSTAGDSIILTLDSAIQFAAEQALQETVESTHALDGSAIVMNPHTGEILAMASYPAFDPNLYNTDVGLHQRNRSIQDIYEPGSTFKVVTLAAVLNEGLADLDEEVDCRVGTLRLAGKVYREASHGYGQLSVREVLAKSSNVGTIKLALRLGKQRFYEYIKNFGFGDNTGIDLPFESNGRVRSPAEWSKISIGALAIGQELSVTPLQMLRAISVIANGGYLVQPRVIHRILNPEGQLVAAPETVRRRVISASTAEQLRSAMKETVEHGTGTRARLSGFSAAGKTGTAQKFVGGGYSRTKYVSSFIGFAPAESPSLACIVVINEPVGAYYGGVVAAPVFREIMERALIKLGVPRDQPSSFQLASSGKMEPEGEKGVSEKRDLSMEVLPETVAALVGTGQEGLSDNVVARVTDGVQLPDFSGLSLRQAAEVSARYDLALSFSGQGRVVAQRPPAQTLVSPGTVCELVLAENGEEKVATRRDFFSRTPGVAGRREGGGFDH